LGEVRCTYVVQVVRKERAVGVVPKGTVIYEQLEELAISAASNLVDMPVPFCAFNGGADVFVDIGNKSLGLHALMKFLGAKSEQVHFTPPQLMLASAPRSDATPLCLKLKVNRISAYLNQSDCLCDGFSRIRRGAR
jgi:hypothetical protein